MSHIDGCSDMVSTVLCDCERRGKKRSNGLSAVLYWRKLSSNTHLHARHFSSYLYPTGTFEANAPVLEHSKSEFG